jgi:hypothetical protein
MDEEPEVVVDDPSPAVSGSRPSSRPSSTSAGSRPATGLTRRSSGLDWLLTIFG